MTIRSGTHMSARPFFVRLPGEVNESTGQQVNEFASWRVNRLVSDRSDKSDSADATKCKSPLAPKFAPFAAISIIISIRYNLTDRKNRPFGLFFGLVWVIIKSGVGVAYFKKLIYICDRFLHNSRLFGLLLKC